MKNINQITGQIVDAAMRVHSALGPGLLESAYEACLLHELRKRGINAVPQFVQPVCYDGIKIDVGYRIDLFVEGRVVVELKAVDKIVPIHEAQLLTYLKLSGCSVGLLLNFNVLHMKNGIKRMVNGLVDDASWKAGHRRRALCHRNHEGMRSKDSLFVIYEAF